MEPEDNTEQPVRKREVLWSGVTTAVVVGLIAFVVGIWPVFGDWLESFAEFEKSMAHGGWNALLARTAGIVLTSGLLHLGFGATVGFLIGLLAGWIRRYNAAGYQ